MGRDGVGGRNDGAGLPIRFRNGEVAPVKRPPPTIPEIEVDPYVAGDETPEPFVGSWRILDMEVWGPDYIDRGWAVLVGDTLEGRLFIHRGDDSAFSAKRSKTKLKSKPMPMKRRR